LVFALRDRWQLSNDTFKGIEAGKKRPAELGTFWNLLQTHPPLRKWLAEAVHRNQMNSNGNVKTPDFVNRILNRGPRPGGGGGPGRDRKPPDRAPMMD